MQDPSVLTHAPEVKRDWVVLELQTDLVSRNQGNIPQLVDQFNFVNSVCLKIGLKVIDENVGVGCVGWSPDLYGEAVVTRLAVEGDGLDLGVFVDGDFVEEK